MRVLVEIRSFNTDTSTNDISGALTRDGAVIVHKVLDNEQISSLASEVDSAFESSAGQLSFDETDKANVKFFGTLPLRVPSAIDSIILNDQFLGISDKVLGPNCHSYRIHASGSLMAMPGGTRQPLHRDLDLFMPYIEFGPEHPVYAIYSLWALDEFRKENGATILVPGSHRWPKGRAPSEDELRFAEMPVGSVVMWLGRTIHGGGANTTKRNRRAILNAVSVDWLSQEENFYIGIPQEMARTYPKRMQQLLGYDAAPTYNWSWGRRSENTLEVAVDVSETGPNAVRKSKQLTGL
jgi:Phytanoyl-CoA dioxygenase (PhyH)